MTSLPSGFAPVRAVRSGGQRPTGLSVTFTRVERDAVRGYLSASAVRALGDPVAILVGVGEAREAIAIVAGNPNDPDARRLTAKKAGGSFGATLLARRLFAGETGSRKITLTSETPGVLVGRVNEGAQ